MFAYKLAPFARSAPCSSAKLVRSFNSTRVALKDIVINVPHMSESISEGTLIKFAKQPGEAVAIDDIVAVIETDKVSVDVRSPHAGVMKGFHANLNDNVKVGAQLCTIDSDGKAVAASAPSAAPAAAPRPVAAPTISAPAPAPAATTAPAPSVAAASPHSASASRVPAIHFRHGKRPDIDAQTGLYSKHAHSAAPAHIGDYNQNLDVLFPSKASKGFLDVAPMFGRPPLNLDESFLIDSGGAYGAPPPAPVDKKKAKK